MSDKIVTIGEQAVELSLTHEHGTFRAGTFAVELIEVRPSEAEIRFGGRTFVVPYSIRGTTISFAFDGETWIADVADKGSRAKARHRDHSMSAPMPGVVLRIIVSRGDVVTKGKTLVILEAMKMEHQITAPYDGTVAAVNCREGEMVQPGLDLVELTPSGEGSAV